MFILKLTLMLVGILLVGFGYFIYFKGKYNLINNFEVDKRNNRYDNFYAKRVGLIELIGGLLIFSLGVLSMFFDNSFINFVYTSSLVGIILSLIVNMIFSTKKK